MKRVLVTAAIQSRNFFLIAILTATLTACAQTSWQDFSGNNRGGAELQMDTAGCQLDSQSAPQADTSNCTNNGCLAGGAVVNILSQVNNFNLCMQSRGWQRVQVAQVAPQMQVAEIDDEDDTDDDDEIDDSDNEAQPQDEEVIASVVAAYNAQDYATAAKWLRVAAYKYHDPRGKFGLAKLYVNGTGVKQNYQKAFMLFHEIASTGTGEMKAAAEDSVGTMYAKGLGVPPDSQKATHWLKKAAAHGDPTAHANLVSLRQNGLPHNAVNISSRSPNSRVAMRDKRPEQPHVNKEKKSNDRNEQ